MSLANLHVVVLAAGKGTRMRSAIPKVLHAVAGKPLLGHVLDSAWELNPAAIHVVVGHGKDAIQQSFDNQTLNWVEQAEQLGTGHAVMQALPAIDDDDKVLILAGDVPPSSKKKTRTANSVLLMKLIPASSARAQGS